MVPAATDAARAAGARASPPARRPTHPVVDASRQAAGGCFSPKRRDHQNCANISRSLFAAPTVSGCLFAYRIIFFSADKAADLAFGDAT